VYGRRVAWVWALMLLGGLSRVYVGAHWVTDVVGGWALGALLGAVAWALAVWASPEGHLAALRKAGARGASEPRRVPPSAAPEAPRSP
jgi:membrane-associated phospholipid phosphatase